MKLPVYLDHAATTPVSDEVLAAMLPYLTHVYGNSASIHQAGREAADAVERAREQVASALGADAGSIVFTSGGTEADNLAVKGVFGASPAWRNHILCSSIEHSAVLEACLGLRSLGAEVELVPVGGTGITEPSEVARRIKRETCLVCVMHANNEVGAIQPVNAISAVCSSRDTPLLVDAVQTPGLLPLEGEAWATSALVAMASHKVYGPKGVGALSVPPGLAVKPMVEGGHQERGRRAGTIDVAGVVGFGAALAAAEELRPAEVARLSGLQARLIDGVLEGCPGAVLTGSRTQRLANHTSFCFPALEGEAIVVALDGHGVCGSAGAACSAGTVEPSHVLRAMGVSDRLIRGALRLTLGRSTTHEQIDYVLDVLPRAVAELRG